MMRSRRCESPVGAGADAEILAANPVPLIVKAFLDERMYYGFK